MPEWNDVVKSLEDDVFTYYRWDDKFDEDLDRIYHPIFDLLKESSEGLVICANTGGNNDLEPKSLFSSMRNYYRYQEQSFSDQDLVEALQ